MHIQFNTQDPGIATSYLCVIKKIFTSLRIVGNQWLLRTGMVAPYTNTATTLLKALQGAALFYHYSPLLSYQPLL